MKEYKNKDIVSLERKTFDLKSVSSMVLPLAKKMIGKKGFIEIDVLMNWPEIVGEDMAKYVLPQSIVFRPNCRTNVVLKVAVPSGSFSVELHTNRQIFMPKLHFFFGN